MYRYIFPFITSFFSSFILTPLMMKLAGIFKIMDYPNERKIHAKPIPLLGGIAIFLSFNLGVFVSMDYNIPLKGVIYGGTLIFLVGLIDDLKHIPARYRLFIQILSVGILFSCGICLKIFPFKWLNYLFTIIWVVGITNAMNFLDNMDWLAVGIAMVSSLFFFAISNLSGDRWLGFISISIAGSCLGFSFYNFPPAKIFMGDSGATFLGFILSSIAVMGEWSNESKIVGIAIPILILYILIFDMILITVLRVLEGKVKNFREWIEYTGKDHFSHRLVALGFSQTRAVLFIIYCCIVLGSVSLLVYKISSPLLALFSIIILFSITVYSLKIFYGKYLK